MCFAPQPRALFRHLNFQKCSEPLVFLTCWLPNVLRATTAYTFSTSQLPNVLWRWGVLYILTWKCASRHNGVHFFNISTSKSGPNLWCFFHILTSKCASRHNGVHFFDSQLPNVLWRWGFLYILTWKCASRHNGVHFFISHLASWLRTRRFSEPTFRPPEPPNHEKNTVFRDFPTFSRTLHLLSSVLFSSDSSPCWLLFHLSILSEVWLLNFLRSCHRLPRVCCPIARKPNRKRQVHVPSNAGLMPVRLHQAKSWFIGGNSGNYGIYIYMMVKW